MNVSTSYSRKVSHELNQILYPKKQQYNVTNHLVRLSWHCGKWPRKLQPSWRTRTVPMLKKQKMQKVAGEKKTKGRGRGRGKGRGKGGKGRGNGKKPNAKDEESEQKPEEKDNNVRRVEEDQKHEGSVKQVEVQAETSEEHQAEHSEKTEEEIPCPRSTPRVLRRTKSKRRMLLKKANSMSPKGEKKSHKKTRQRRRLNPLRRKLKSWIIQERIQSQPKRKFQRSNAALLTSPKKQKRMQHQTKKRPKQNPQRPSKMVMIWHQKKRLRREMRRGKGLSLQRKRPYWRHIHSYIKELLFKVTRIIKHIHVWEACNHTAV